MKISLVLVALLELAHPRGPLVLQLHHPSLQLQLHLALHVLHLSLQPQQLLLDPALPADPGSLLFLATSPHHRQHLFLQLLHLPESAFLPPPLFLLPDAQDGPHPAVVLVVVLRLVVAVVVVGGGPLRAFFGGEADLVGDV
jgi:hypothetical protein